MRKLGLRPKRGLKTIKLKDILTGVIPAHPPTADHFANVGDWGLYGNDRYGVCGPTAVANSRKLVTKYLTDAEQSPTQDDVFDLYRRSGNPNFDPATGADDNGVDMATMLTQVAQGGIGGVSCVAFAEVDPQDLETIKAAIAIFGFGLQGITLQNAQQQQSDAGLWDYSASPVWGGHAVLNGLYTSASGQAATLKVISWAQVIGETVAFLQKQLDQMFVLIWAEAFGTTQFQAGIDLSALQDDYKELTGRDLPVPGPTPAPGTTTLAQQIDAMFALLEQRYANRPFLLRMIKAVHAWVDAYLAQNPTAFGTFSGTVQLTVAQLKAILDQILGTLETTLPAPYGGYVAIVQTLLDALITVLNPSPSTRCSEFVRTAKQTLQRCAFDESWRFKESCPPPKAALITKQS